MDEKKLRVWWIPQVPMEAFYVNVKSVDEARKLLQVLADYDTFQFEKRIKPDYSNTGGLQMLEGKEWLEWYCSRCDEDIDKCECK